VPIVSGRIAPGARTGRKRAVRNLVTFIKDTGMKRKVYLDTGIKRKGFSRERIRFGV
jgi:hypothetical protein